MILTSKNLHFFWRFHAVLLLLVFAVIPSLGLNTDGILLLSFKYSVLSDPLLVLQSWNYDDETPCSWNGVICNSFPEFDYSSRVTSLILPNNQLLGSIPTELGLIEHLRHLDLSNNYLNGSLPIYLFNSSNSELEILSLSNNKISGELPEFVGELKSLQLLNLSDNAFTGRIPHTLTLLSNLTVLSLRNNYFNGGFPNGFNSVEVLDFSSNLINESLPPDFSGENLHYLNLSYNRISGEIPLDFANSSPDNFIIDLSFNNLTGEVPELGFKAESLRGNVGLCGKPLKNPCTIPSTLSTSPNASTPTTTSPPAIAVIPKPIDSPSTSSLSPTSSEGNNSSSGTSKLKPRTIVAIIVGDLAGIGILFIIFFYVYQSKRKRNVNNIEQKQVNVSKEESFPLANSKVFRWCCFRKKDTGEETSHSSSTDTEEDENTQQKQKQVQRGGGSLVTLDGETELELETLLKASAYILGATSSSIVYKAVLQDGSTLAVRRIGENGEERFRDFVNQVRIIAKLRHPNLVRIRGYYWGVDEKLVIYDYVPNGSLANACYKRPGSSPYQLPWETRLLIARGVARGLTYLHEKKHVHGNLKPTNILLGPDMEPKIGDFGLERLVLGENSYKGGSARNFGSKRSTMSRDSLQEIITNPIAASPSPSSTSMSGAGTGASPYQAPESLKNLKPSTKWDVFSFGIILLELLTGRVFLEHELSQWTTSPGIGLGHGGLVEDKNRVLRMADIGIRGDVEGKEETLMTCFKLGFNCTSLVPAKRPTMKEVHQILEKIPSHNYNSHL